MNEFINEIEKPEYYFIIPEYNRFGRLCNYHTGDNMTVKVMADEWERFNTLAGRQHEIIDDVAVYNPDLLPCLPDGAIEQKTSEISNACRQAIVNGIDVETSHGVKHFSLNDDDQRNIDNLSGKVMMRVIPLENGLPYHADNDGCLMYTADDIIRIATAKDSHILYHTTYHNQLKEYIKSDENISGVYYGMELPEPYKSKFEQIISMFTVDGGDEA